MNKPESIVDIRRCYTCLEMILQGSKPWLLMFVDDRTRFMTWNGPRRLTQDYSKGSSRPLVLMLEGCAPSELYLYGVGGDQDYQLSREDINDSYSKCHPFFFHSIIAQLGDDSHMSKRSGSSIPLTAEKVKSKKRLDSPISKSDSSSDPHDETEHNLLAPAPLSYAPLIPPLVGPALLVGDDDFAEWRKKYLLPPYVVLRASSSSEQAYNCMPEEIAVAYLDLLIDISEFLCAAGTHHALSEGESNVLRARTLPLEHRQVVYLLSSTTVAKPPYVRTCQETLRNIRWSLSRRRQRRCQQKGFVSKDTSDDDMTITESRRKTVVKVEPTSSSQGKKSKDAEIGHSSGGLSTVLSNLNLKVFLQDQTHLSEGEPSEVIQVFHGELLRNLSQLHHLGEGLSEEGVSSNREELEKLICQLFEKKGKCTAREMEICDLQAKVKAQESMVEASSAEALTLGKEKQELEKIMSDLRKSAETFKYEMVMAVNGARITARWELTREWLRR
ncbi:LOW QUALITY PROTEIN: hypothetical protein HID58_091498 [Brassica napus]|uniref:Uncharacterized protein n=1 Tax=Brassica napus TaxID=3708 RepID=A0ABQ7WZS3_BRANA|nr:LOW QUALITY PROTEIN: hypothetical protein HID58_091498 [Brassica napus]